MPSTGGAEFTQAIADGLKISGNQTMDLGLVEGGISSGGGDQHVRVKPCPGLGRGEYSTFGITIREGWMGGVTHLS